MAHDVREASGRKGLLRFFVTQVFYLSIILAVLNLIPLPPLDGSKCFQAFVQMTIGRSAAEAFNSLTERAGLILFAGLLLSSVYWISRDVIAAAAGPTLAAQRAPLHALFAACLAVEVIRIHWRLGHRAFAIGVLVLAGLAAAAFTRLPCR